MKKEIPYTDLLDTFEDQRLLIEIGRDLMRERDLDKLLRRILEVSRQITGADAGSIYLAETDPGGNSVLRFKYSRTISKDLPYEEFTMPRTMGSIAGYVSLTGHTLNVPDVYELPADLPYHFNNVFDREHGYRTKSMLAVPMTDHTGAVVGVIQLMNSKETIETYGEESDKVILTTPEDFELKVCAFKERYGALMEAMAGQAAVALENATMIKRIQTQFEQFVSASVDAVEARDPATSGHSSRVAYCAVGLAGLLNRNRQEVGLAPVFTDFQIKELEFAGLLHDFGKVYIDPGIFLKAKKLFPGDYERLQLRLKYLRRSIELDFTKRELPLGAEDRKSLDGERDLAVKEMLEVSRLIERLNEPTLMAEDPAEMLRRIRETPLPTVLGIDEEEIPLLTESESANLGIRRGSLNAEERSEIERHVVLSYDFVKKIPWPAEYSKIPDYIRAHHEMLDGSGYPDHLQGDQIPLQARLLAVADIYDALTASDRPYKRAASQDKALSILLDEAQRGRLDPDLVALMSVFLASVAQS